MPFEAPLFSEVAASLAAYFDGLHQSDSARLAECWHPDARLYGLSPDGAELLERDAPTFFAGVDARAPSPCTTWGSTPPSALPELPASCHPPSFQWWRGGRQAADLAPANVQHMHAPRRHRKQGPRGELTRLRQF